MDLTIQLNIFTVGTISGVGSFFILGYQFFAKRYSFFKYLSNEQGQKILLLSAICKAELNNFKFIRTGKDIVIIGHTQGNQWIKPYDFIPNLYSNSGFLNSSEIYTYKIDWFLLMMIRIARICKNKNISKIDIAKFDKDNHNKEEYCKIYFYQSKDK